MYENADTLYIVTEHISGGSLEKYFAQHNFSLPETECKEIILDLASGLSYLHTLGIVHRDIKLENILLHISSDRVQPIIIDYGLSCILGPYQYARDLVGTLKYAAPELLSDLPYREMIDVWGLGLISYILLSGDMPFYGDDSQIVHSILHKPLDFKKKAWKNVSTQGKMIVASLLKRNPLKRLNLNKLYRHEWANSEHDLHKDVISKNRV